MAARMETTRHRGIYKRGSRYTLTYRVDGRQRWESAPDLKTALKMKRRREADRDSGEFFEASRERFRDYASEWIDRYQGNGRRGFTDDTRADYKRDLERYVFPFFDERLGRPIAGITPRDVANWIAWLCDEQEQGRRVADEKRQRIARREKVSPPVVPAKPVRLSDATVRRILSPLRACLSSARREGLIRSNPVDGAALPHRPKVDEGEPGQRVRAMTRNQLAMFLRIVRSDWRVMFQFLASTGLRWGEVAAVRWRDLRLDGSEPCVHVRQALARRRKGEPPRFKPPKSNQARTVPLDAALVSELRGRRATARFAAYDDLVFPAENGEPLRQENVRRRVLSIAAQEADVPWIGFHTFRHTCASLLFDAGRNVKQVQRWLGHHSPAFTLERYVHLLDDGVGDGLDLAAELGQGANKVQTQRAANNGTQPQRDLAEMAH